MSKFEKVNHKIHNARYFHKISDLIEDLNDREYYNLMGPYRIPVSYYNIERIENGRPKYRTIQLTSNLQEAKTKRDTIVDTLYSIKFKRVNNWDKFCTIAFMEEMMRYKFDKIPEGKTPEDYLNEIAERYSIPRPKVKSTMSILITNIKRGYDQYNLLDYFSWYELFQYKYKDNDEQLAKDFEEGKLNNIEESIYRQVTGVD